MSSALRRLLRAEPLAIDPRALGAFRVAMALALLGDLASRWAVLREFYTNEGVIPNHNHLFVQRDTGRVWSLLHSFSTEGDAKVAFAFILGFYLLFLVGKWTRVAHALSLVSFVSLVGRNVLLEGPGTQLGVALLAVSLLLPCGSRLSLDALGAALRARDEHRPEELAARLRPEVSDEDADRVDAARLPGWSPASVAAVGLLAVFSVVHLSLALRRTGPAWADGSALRLALWDPLSASAFGAASRDAGWVPLLGRALRPLELAIAVLPWIPVGTRFVRPVALALSLGHALALAALHQAGIFPWALAAASLLLLPRSLFAHLAAHPSPSRRRTVIFDEDCGICLFLARVLARLDLRGHLVLQGNGGLRSLWVQGWAPGTPKKSKKRPAPAGLSLREMPAEVTPELVSETVVVVDDRGRVHTRARAVAAAIEALPLGFLVARPMRAPGISHALDALYGVVARNRIEIGVGLGFAACGVPLPAGQEPPPPPAFAAPPSTRLHRLVTGLARELAAAAIVLVVLLQSAKQNPLPARPAVPPSLDAAAAWLRLGCSWSVGTEPAERPGLFVIDAVGKDGATLDPLTLEPPRAEPLAPGVFRLGPHWALFLDRMRRPESEPFRKAFRDFVTRGGRRVGKPAEVGVTAYEAYWVTQAIPAPGQAPDAASIDKQKLFGVGRASGLKPVRPVAP